MSEGLDVHGVAGVLQGAGQELAQEYARGADRVATPLGLERAMRIWFVDTFTDQVFSGNTAAVVPLTQWLPDETLQAIAAQNRCSETAFVVSTGLKGNFQLRWFTPETEVTLCGHATLAAGAVLLTEKEPDLDVVVFDTQSGPLVVRETSEGFTLDLPRRTRLHWDPPADLVAALGADLAVDDAFSGEYANIVLSEEAAVRALRPDIAAIARLVRGPRVGNLCVTAVADKDRPYDFVCRFFAPGVGIPEDPVTGSAFADLTPYWCDRLGRNSVTGFQASSRGGLVRGLQTLTSSRLLGRVAVYLRGELDPAVARFGRASTPSSRPAVAENPIAPVVPAGSAWANPPKRAASEPEPRTPPRARSEEPEQTSEPEPVDLPAGFA